MKYLLPAIIILTLCIAACSPGDSGRYEIIMTEKGKMVRLDRRTGGVAKQSGTDLIVLNEIDRNGKDRDETAGRKVELGDITINELGDVKASMDVKITGGEGTGRMLFYHLQITPLSDVLKNAYEDKRLRYAKIVLLLKDPEGFVIEETDLVLMEMYKIFDEAGEAVGLEYSDDSYIQFETSRTPSSWSIRWENLT